MAEASEQSEPPQRLLIAQLGRPIREFLSTEVGSAGLLLTATIIALIWANSPFSDSYESLWTTELSIHLGPRELVEDLRHWVNDGLMILFFFVIGLEVRREISVGELTDHRRLIVPAAGAIGGMLVAALLYLLVNPSGEASNGWGVVIGTDTAFLLGGLAIVGPALSTQLRVFLLTMTIADDVLAVSIIGVAYSDSLNFVALGIALVCLLGIAALAQLRIWRSTAYVLTGVALWLATLESGLHPTIAGMAAGLLVGAYTPRREEVDRAASLFNAFRQSPLPSMGRSAKQSVERAISVNERFQESLHPLSGYIIVPLFALANAGIDLRGGQLGEALGSPVTWGVVLGLVAGKFAGIGLFSLGAARFRLGPVLPGVGPGQILGGAALSGIGFTVSLLIADLAFTSPELREQAVIGVLMAAGISFVMGWATFQLAARLHGERTATLPMVLDRPIVAGRDHIRGPVNAPMTLVEYGDFECPFCGAATGVVAELRERFGDDLRYVFRHLPLADVHPHAELAAEAAEAAAAQDRFWDMHDLLFANQDQLQFEDLVGYAGKLDLDVEEFTRTLTESRHAARIRDDVASAEASGARGTPTFFIGEDRHEGAWDTDSLALKLTSTRWQQRVSAEPEAS